MTGYKEHYSDVFAARDREYAAARAGQMSQADMARVDLKLPEHVGGTHRVHQTRPGGVDEVAPIYSNGAKVNRSSVRPDQVWRGKQVGRTSALQQGMRDTGKL